MCGERDVALPFHAVEHADSPAPAMAGQSMSSPLNVGQGRVTAESADLTLEMLMRQALEVPGAATALLEAYAAQSRALRMVQEAEARGAATLPSELRHRLAAVAARTPTWLSAEGAGLRG
jgi:hypothetical protein